MTKQNKKGQITLGGAPVIVTTLVVLAIVLGLGATIVNNFQSNLQTQNLGVNCGQNSTGGASNPAFTNCGYGYNITGDGLSGLDSFGGFQTTIAIVVVAAVVLGLVGLIAFARR